MFGAGRTPWMHTLYVPSLLLSEIASLFFQNLYNVPPGCSIIPAVRPLIRWRGGITAANNTSLYKQSDASGTFDWNNKHEKGLERGVAPIFCPFLSLTLALIVVFFSNVGAPGVISLTLVMPSDGTALSVKENRRVTDGFSLFVASTDVTKGQWKDERGTSSQIHLRVRGRPGSALAPQLTEHSAWCRDSHVCEVVRAMWRRWRMSSGTSALLSTSGHTKTHFNEQLKVRLAHFRPWVTPTATAGRDVPSMPSWPVCSGSASPTDPEAPNGLFTSQMRRSIQVCS